MGLLTGTYGWDQSSGRVAVMGTNASPVCYLANAVDDVAGFCVSTNAIPASGAFNVQRAATYSNSSLAGNFFFGSDECLCHGCFPPL